MPKFSSRFIIRLKELHDRIIVATCKAVKASGLVTKDEEIVQSRIVRTINFKRFMEQLDSMIRRFEIKLLFDEPRYHGIASVLESKYDLTFFDSLHASVALVNRTPIVSFDDSYDKVSEKGFKRIKPNHI